MIKATDTALPFTQPQMVYPNQPAPPVVLDLAPPCFDFAPHLAATLRSEITQHHVEVLCTAQHANHLDPLFKQTVEDVVSVEAGDGPGADAPEGLPRRLRPHLRLPSEEFEGRRDLVIPA